MSGVWNLWHSTQWCKSWPFRNKSLLGHPFELGFPQHCPPSPSSLRWALPPPLSPSPHVALVWRTATQSRSRKLRRGGGGGTRRGARKETVLERRLSWWCNVVWTFCTPWLLLNSFEFWFVQCGGGSGVWWWWPRGRGMLIFHIKRESKMHWEVRCDLDVVLGIPLHRRE